MAKLLAVLALTSPTWYALYYVVRMLEKLQEAQTVAALQQGVGG